MKDYLILCKPRIAVMVMATAALGYAASGSPVSNVFFWTLLGVGLASAACGCLNQLIERKQDGLMARTRNRPIAAGRGGAPPRGPLGPPGGV